MESLFYRTGAIICYIILLIVGGTLIFLAHLYVIDKFLKGREIYKKMEVLVWLYKDIPKMHLNAFLSELGTLIRKHKEQ